MWFYMNHGLPLLSLKGKIYKTVNIELTTEKSVHAPTQNSTKARQQQKINTKFQLCFSRKKLVEKDKFLNSFISIESFSIDRP